LFVICAGVDGDDDADEVAPGTENLVAPGAESSLTSQVVGLCDRVLPSCGTIDSVFVFVLG